MIKITDDGNIVYENQPESPRALYPNIHVGKIQDVQINGNSIINEQTDVAEIPAATAVNLGVIRIGDGLLVNDGTVTLNKASQEVVKGGTGEWEAITPNIQHISVFYGIAKAAGDTTQAASDNAVGNYTDEAKALIRKMLGLEIDFELIKEITTDSALTELEINTDNNNNSFKLKELVLIATLGTPTTSKTDTFNSSYKVRVHGASEDSYMGNVSFQYPSASSGMKIRCQAEALSNAPFIIRASHAVNDSTNANEETRIKSEIVEYISAFKLARANSTSSNIPVGSTFKMYGIRYSE